jgi:hypothetical protein
MFVFNGRIIRTWADIVWNKLNNAFLKDDIFCRFILLSSTMLFPLSFHKLLIDPVIGGSRM